MLSPSPFSISSLLIPLLSENPFPDMEDDDEFGDLYTDVLRPLEAEAAYQLQGRPIDLNVNSDDEEILYGASDFKNSAGPSKLNASLGEKTLPGSVPRSDGGGFDLNLNSNSRVGPSFGGKGLEKSKAVKSSEKGSGGVDFMEEDDDLNIVVEERDNKDDDLVEKDTDLSGKKENLYTSAEGNENMVKFMHRSGDGEGGTDPIIPGLSGRLENHGGSNFEYQWESDESEDDLQIVLNDNHGPIGMERMPGVDDEDDEDGEPLVIVADNGDAVHHHHHPPMMMDEHEWGGEEAGAGADGEKKELGDASKASGVGTGPPASVQPKLGYSNHMYHHPFHSQFKYVRPGVAPLPGASPVALGGVQSQIRPPTTTGPIAGRGRGDWRPAGMKGAAPLQKGFHPGYGGPAWGPNAGGRGYGSGLDFTLPSHKTIFEVDIDGFEEKPWKLPGIDLSDFFNFGLNEEIWKDYCKQLEQLRLETTMQSKIRVYESGRAEQGYDPDLPPELAAAVGAQDISTENANHGKTDAGLIARGRPPVPTGRPIPVETGSSDRLPSIDTRRPRMHDYDAIIEIVCHSSTDDPDVAEQPEDEPDGEDLEGVTEPVDPHQDDVDHSSHASNGQKRREPVSRRALAKKTSSDDYTKRQDDSHYSSEVQCQTDKEIDFTHEERSSKGRDYLKSPNSTARDSDRENNKVDDQNELVNSEDGKQSPPLSSSHAVGSDEEQAVAVGDDMKEEFTMDDRSSDVEEDAPTLGATASDDPEEGKLIRSTNKGKVSSHVEQLSQENNDGEEGVWSSGKSSHVEQLSQENNDGEEGVWSSGNSKARSGSSKDHRKPHDHFDDEVLQTGSSKRPVAEEDNVPKKTFHERDETGRRNAAVKEREDSHTRRIGDTNSALHRQMKSDSADRRRDSDVSEGSWRRRDEDLHGRRSRVEDTRKREHGNEIGSKNRVKDRENEKGEKDDRRHIKNQRDDNSWKGASHDQVMVSRQRDRDDNLRTRSEKIDDVHNRRRKDVPLASRDHGEKEDVTHNYREGSNRRKRERDDSSDQRKRDDHVKPRDDDVHYVRQKQEGSTQKERGERQRDRDEWNRAKQSHEESVSRREREETRPSMRSARTTEEKTWSSHSRAKDDHKASGREYHQKDAGRQSDQLKRRDRAENENLSQHRGHEDVYARGNQVSEDEKKARHGRPGTSDERAVRTSDSSRLHEHKQKEGGRKSKESEGGDRGSFVHAKRNEDEHSKQISETANARGRTERTKRGSSKDDIHASRHSSKKHREDASSGDETASKKGRSKLERWASHKENDLGVDSTSSVTTSLKKSKDNNAGSSAIIVPHEEPPKKAEDKKPRPPVEKDSGAETNSADAKVVDDKHLDTVAKLKKRSERFKLPMPSEKDAAVSIKKMESEPLLPSAPAENHQDSEIKSERPARKRRWTGN